jgi:lysophospholipase L1-like esterase
MAASEASFSRYVAIGDSTTEGLDDPRPGGGYRGWADRLAERLGELNPDLLYANLAIRGRLTGQIHAEQLDPALAMEPDLVTVVAGLNDVLRPGFDLEATAGHIDAMQAALAAAGATVVTFTLPDASSVMPIARLVRTKLLGLNREVRAMSRRNGALVVEFEASAVGSDRRLWSEDRLHANSAGHERIYAALARALELPGSDDSWQTPLPPVPRPGRAEAIAAELAWTGRYMAPWVLRRLRGRSSGDGISAKRPRLAPVALTEPPAS